MSRLLLLKKYLMFLYFGDAELLLKNYFKIFTVCYDSESYKKYLMFTVATEKITCDDFEYYRQIT